MTTISMKRTEALDRLAEQLAAAEKYDAARLKAHQAEESAWVKLFRLAAKDLAAEAAKSDYKACVELYGKARGYGRGRGEKVTTWADWPERPSCPTPVAPRIANCIANLQLSTAARINASERFNSDLFAALSWTATPYKAPTC